jgi:hypothetical protein
MEKTLQKIDFQLISKANKLLIRTNSLKIFFRQILHFFRRNLPEIYYP